MITIERICKRDPQAAAVKLTELRVMTAGTIADVRRVIRALRPIYLEDLGLPVALETLARELEHSTAAPVAFTNVGEPRRLTPAQEMAIYRIAQEALNNSVKHARARHASIAFALDPNGILRISVTDDGVGGVAPGEFAACQPASDRPLASARSSSREMRGAMSRLCDSISSAASWSSKIIFES